MTNTIYSQVREYSFMRWTQEASTWEGAQVKGKINCFGDDFLLLLLFLEKGSPVPPPKVHHWATKKKVDLFLPGDEMQSFIDMLRHEKHVFVHIDLEHPERTHLTTEKNQGKEVK